VQMPFVIDSVECIEISDCLWGADAVHERILQPWEEHRYALTSWWEMISFSSRSLYRCGIVLRSIKADCHVASAICLDGELGFAVLQELDERARTKALRGLRIVQSQFHALGMSVVADTVGDTIGDLEVESPKRNFQWLIDQITFIERLVEKTLKEKVFFYVPSESAKFFPRLDNPHIFGGDVAAAFTSAAYDISESGTCLALSRGTACVFHLMRVLEIGLTVLGKKFGVLLTHTNWAPAIEQIESRIRDMHKDPTWRSLPDYKQQQEFYAQAASHFGILKDAWRNYTMHVRGFYTEEQAERIFENVKGFMQKLAERLSE
jgi:hypothetical protein